MSQEASIALNRFGLGARPDQNGSDNPKAWLKQQLEAFDPRPATLAANAKGAAAVTGLSRA